MRVREEKKGEWVNVRKGREAVDGGEGRKRKGTERNRRKGKGREGCEGKGGG